MKWISSLYVSLVSRFAGRSDSVQLGGEAQGRPSRSSQIPLITASATRRCRPNRSCHDKTLASTGPKQPRFGQALATRLAVVGACLTCMGVGNTRASDWTGPGGTLLWNDPENWRGGVAGNSGGAGGSAAVFNVDNGATIITIDEDRWVPSITFGADAGAYTLGSEGPDGGFALHLAASSEIVMDAGMTNEVNFHAPIVLEGGSTWTNNNTSFDINSEGSLTLTGTLTLNGDGDFNMDGLMTGAGGLIMDGTGTAFLNNPNNSYSGSVQIKSGALNTVSISNYVAAPNSVPSGLGDGRLIALGDNRREESIGRLIVSSPTGGSTDRIFLLRTGNNADSATGSGGVLESAVAGQTVTFNGFVRAQNSGEYTETQLTPGEEYRSYLELTGDGDGVMAGIVGGSNTSGENGMSINMELRKTGTGVWALQGANLYHRRTSVEEGTLLANNATGSATGTSSVLVSAGATLGGTGSISGGASESITLGADSRLMIGASHGAGGAAHDLVLGNSAPANNVAVNLHGTLQFDIMGGGSMDDLGDGSYNSLGASNDLLEIFTEGEIDLGGAVVQIAAEDTEFWEAGQSWKLIDWSNVAFENLDTSGLALDLETMVFGEYLLTQSIELDGYYVTASLVPEPGRGLLLLAGVTWLCLRRRRQPLH